MKMKQYLCSGILFIAMSLISGLGFAANAPGASTMSTALQFDLSDVDALAGRMGDLAKLPADELMDAVGHEIETQTIYRLGHEKTSPNGEAWPAWSAEYAKTRHGGHSLLESDAELIGSVQSLPSNSSVEVGSNLVYAARLHFGDEGDGGMPAREWLGLSDDNMRDVNAVVEDFLQQNLAAL